MWNGNFKTALSNLRQSKLRSFFTMLGIIIGVSSVVTIVSLGEGLKGQLIGQMNDIGKDIVTIRPGNLVSKQGDSRSNLNLLAFLTISTLTPGDVNSIEHLPAVKTVVPIDFVTSTVNSDEQRLDNVFVAGVTPQLQTIMKTKVEYGSFFSEDDLDQNFAVIGQSVAIKLFGQPNPVGQTLRISGQDFIVHGVLQTSPSGILSVAQADFNYSVLIPFQPAVDLANGHANILQILVRATDPKNVDQTISQIKHTLHKSHVDQDFTVLREKDLQDVAGQTLDVATGFITAIAAISLLVGGIGIMDIMLVSVSERNREIGIRKAIGATDRQILSQFLIEGLVLTIGGGIIGLGIAFVFNALIRIYTDWEPIISWPIVLISISFSIVVGVVFSTIPAFKAARKDPIAALRGD